MRHGLRSRATHCPGFWQCVYWCLVLALVAGSIERPCLAQGAPAFADLSATDAPAKATVELEKVPNRVRRQLGQLDALLADQAWDEAIELLQTLLVEPVARETVIEAAPGYHVSLADHCHQLIATLPDEALQRYRSLVDPAARRRYEQARPRRDTTTLRQIVDESFCSTWGDDALLTLGEIALEQGDFAAARRYWRQINPLLSDPGGRPLSWAARGIDLAQHGETILEHLRQTPRTGDWLVYPDSDLPIADLWARMASASIREGDFDRAQQEIGLLRLMMPDAVGQVAGREAPLAVTLTELLTDAETQSTPSRGATSVGVIAGRLWPQPRPLFQSPALTYQIDRFGRRTQVASTVLPPPQAEPVAWGRVVLFRDGPSIQAADLLTGEPAINQRGELHRSLNAPRAASSRAGAIRFGVRIQRGPTAINFASGPSSLTLDGDVLYARVGPSELNAVGAAEGGMRITGRDLRRENLTQDVIDVITEYNQLDIEFYEYSKAIFEAQYAKMVAHLKEAYGQETYGQQPDGEEVMRSHPDVETLDTEVLRSLLEKHYERCFREQQGETQSTQRLTFTFDQAVHGHGWHRLEGLERN
ncbi:MAG: hypothetical protein AAGF31_07385, partial [Planctomycetota bacterium]